MLNLDQGDVLETFFHELQHYKHWLLTGEPPEDGLLPDDPSEILAEKQGQVDYSAFLQEHGELVDESGGLIRLANNRKIIGELNEAR